MNDMLREPVELTESELDEVAGGKWEIMIKIGSGSHKIGESISQTNSSVNLLSAGNNNNGTSGNQFYFG
jgi:hypothetical protein